MDCFIGILIDYNLFEYVLIQKDGESLYPKRIKKINNINVYGNIVEEIKSFLKKEFDHIDQKNIKGIGIFCLNLNISKENILSLKKIFTIIPVIICENIGLVKCFSINSFLRKSMLVLPSGKICAVNLDENGEQSFFYLEKQINGFLEFDHINNMFFSDIPNNKINYKQIDMECDNIPDGSKGLYYKINNSDERSFIGIKEYHNRGNFIKSVYETWALLLFNYIENNEFFSQLHDIEFTDESFLLKNLLQTIANITGRNVVFRSTDLAVGAAINAGVVLNEIKIEQVLVKINREKLFKPARYIQKL
jgi:hypothetical protein